jgi:hypothetical protein
MEVGTGEIRARSGGKTGAATIVVTSPPGPGDGTPFFSDGFESGNLSKQGGPSGRNFSWGAANVAASSVNARSGSYSAKLTFRSDDDPKNQDRPDAWAALFFSFDAISPAEVWVEYYVYFPAGTEGPGYGPAFYHRSQTSGGDQHKLFRVYAAPYVNGVIAGFDMDNAIGNGGNEIGAIHTDGSTLWGAWKLGDHFNGLGGVNGTPSGTIPRGRWVQFRFHIKQSSSASAQDGAIQMWVNGALAWSNTSLKFWGVGGKQYIDAGYIFNYSNAGFDEETYVFVDDVKFFESNPGW